VDNPRRRLWTGCAGGCVAACVREPLLGGQLRRFPQPGRHLHHRLGTADHPLWTTKRPLSSQNASSSTFHSPTTPTADLKTDHGVN
jgi:hypothetical protein